MTRSLRELQGIKPGKVQVIKGRAIRWASWTAGFEFLPHCDPRRYMSHVSPFPFCRRG